MRSWWIAWRLVQARGLHHLVTVVVLALGLGLMLATAAVGDATRGAVSAMAGRYPVVVGPKSGAIPLVLGSLTRLQDLDAGVPVAVWERLASDPRVELAVPLLAGHSVQGHALLGTSPAYLEPRERFPLMDGRVFADGLSEVVLGSDASLTLGLEVGDTVEIEHQHAGVIVEPGSLKVVGILAPTRSDLDGTLLCPFHAILQSHEQQHEHEHEHEHDSAARAPSPSLVSSILLRPVDDDALLALQDDLQAEPDLEVALTGQTLRRITDRLAGGARLLRLLVGGVVLVTFLSLLMSVYGSALAQSREVAVLRVLGARRVQVLGIVALATLGVILCGAVGSMAVAEVLAGAAERVLRHEMGLDATVVLLSASVIAWLAGGLVVLLLVGLQPALAAYHLQVAEALAATAGSGSASRSYLRWSLRFLIPLAIFVWAEQMMARHGVEGVSRPLDAESAAIFEALHTWTSGDAPAVLTALDGNHQEIQGYMYALGDPYEAQDFYLVALNPRMPRCPFCYRAPNRHERIFVRSADRSLEVAPGLVAIGGTMTLSPEERDQLALDLDTFEVVVDP